MGGLEVRDLILGRGCGAEWDTERCELPMN